MLKLAVTNHYYVGTWQRMHYQHVCIESLGYTLPDEVISTTDLEMALQPLYARLRLPEGRLELMTGIRERRFWPAGELPSRRSIESGEKALAAAGIDRSEVGVLIHASVCRDYLEPATAATVHHGLGLPSNCLVYDVSNACLGFLNAMMQVANMIELGQVRAGLVMGTESSRALVETTVAELNRNEAITRDDVKLAVASLTIGSGSAAALLVHRDLSQAGHKLHSAVAEAHTHGHQLCHSVGDQAIGSGMSPLMQTDSERLMHEGIAAGQKTFERFLTDSGWRVEDLDKTVCHQVGMAHRKLLMQSLGLDSAKDFLTFETLGNTGSVAVPCTLAKAVETGHIQKNDRVALMGIGSGINVLIMGVEW